MLFVEIAIVAVLIVFNGLLAMSELAVVSARPARLKAMGESGVSGAKRALALSRDPGRFLSAVQIGITLVGVLSGAFSGATLGSRLGEWLVTTGAAPGIAEPVGVGAVVAVITYFSLIVGELVPKRIALRNPEAVAVRVAPFMTMLSRIALPLVVLLDVSGRMLLKLLGQASESANRVTDEEIRILIAEAEHSGTIESDERRMITGVMRFADRRARAVMTPRAEVDWVDLNADAETIRETLDKADHSLLPAGEGSIDSIVGVVKTRQVLASMLDGKGPEDTRGHLLEAPVVHEYAAALSVLDLLREAEVPFALVHDEFGHFEGIVTPADILEAIAGVFRADAEEGERDVTQRDDGSWLLPGLMPADEMADHLGIVLPRDRNYSTLAGFLLTRFEQLPSIGEKVDALGWRFEILDLDARRIDRVLASRLPESETGEATGDE